MAASTLGVARARGGGLAVWRSLCLLGGGGSATAVWGLRSCRVPHTGWAVTDPLHGHKGKGLAACRPWDLRRRARVVYHVCTAGLALPTLLAPAAVCCYLTHAHACIAVAAASAAGCVPVCAAPMGDVVALTPNTHSVGLVLCRLCFVIRMRLGPTYPLLYPVLSAAHPPVIHP